MGKYRKVSEGIGTMEAAGALAATAMPAAGGR